MAEDAVRIELKLDDFASAGFKKAQGVVAAFSTRSRALLTSVKTSIFSLRSAILAMGAGVVARSFLNVATSVEAMNVRLKVLLGSQEEATLLFDNMQKYAARVPFTLNDVADSATALAGILKGGNREVKQWIPLIGDLAAATGLGIRETTDQVMRMLSAGAASADRFRERGVLAMLGFQAGVSYSAAETRNKLIDAWTSTESKFRGATDEMRDTLAGQFSMVEDAIFKFKQKVMDSGVSFFIKELLSHGVSEMQQMEGSAEQTAEAIISGFVVAGKVLGGVLRTVQLIREGFAWMQTAVYNMITGFSAAAAEISNFMFQMADAAYNLVTKIPASLLKVLQTLKPEIADTIDSLKQSMSVFARGSAENAENLGAMADKYKNLALAAEEVARAKEKEKDAHIDIWNLMDEVQLKWEKQRELMQKQRESIGELKDGMADLGEVMVEVPEKAEEAVAGWRRSLENALSSIGDIFATQIASAFQDWVDGSLKPTREYLKAILKDIGTMLIKKGLSSAIDIAASSIAGAAAGGAVLSAPKVTIPVRAFAAGTPSTPRVTNGPELWWIGEGNRGRQREAIIPLQGNQYVRGKFTDEGGGRPQVVNFNVYAYDSRDVGQWAYQNRSALRDVMTREVSENPGAMQRALS